ncbi:MAG: hypothetical protein ACREXR_05795, partial [Gammaproteobacteria bacterium]
SYTCLDPAGAPVVSAWVWDGNPGTFVNNGTCVTDPPPCTPLATQVENTFPTQSLNCSAGQYGGFQQSRTGTRSRTSYCPGPASISWSAYSYTPWVTTSGSCTTCPAAWTDTALQWVAAAAGCPAGTTGSWTWEKQQTQSRSVNYNCPAGTASAPAPTYGAFSGWADNGAKRSEVNNCLSNCVLPAPATQTQYQWVTAGAACPSGQSGVNTWEKEQYQQRTAYCPAVTGAYAWGAYGAWADTGSTRNVVNTCVPLPPSACAWVIVPGGTWYGPSTAPNSKVIHTIAAPGFIEVPPASRASTIPRYFSGSWGSFYPTFQASAWTYYDSAFNVNGLNTSYAVARPIGACNATSNTWSYRVNWANGASADRVWGYYSYGCDYGAVCP